MIQISDKRVARMSDQEYRHSFLNDMVKAWIAHQLRALREQRGLTQQDMGARCSKPQSTIARLENPDYGGCTVNTLLGLAGAFDVALEVRFVSWPEFLDGTKDLSVGAMLVPSWSTDQFKGMKRENSQLGTSSANVVKIKEVGKARSWRLYDNVDAKIDDILQKPGTHSKKWHLQA